MKISRHNQHLFDELRKLHLPQGQYAITSSGPLGIRNLREIGDIDLIVTQELWEALSRQYGVVDDRGVRKVLLSGGMIEAFCEDSFYSESKAPNDPSVVERIQRAEIIDGLPFEALEDVLFYKRKMGRDKDLADIALIKAYGREDIVDA